MSYAPNSGQPRQSHESERQAPVAAFAAMAVAEHPSAPQLSPNGRPAGVIPSAYPQPAASYHGSPHSVTQTTGQADGGFDDVNSGFDDYETGYYEHPAFQQTVYQQPVTAPPGAAMGRVHFATQTVPQMATQTAPPMAPQAASLSAPPMNKSHSDYSAHQAGGHAQN
ncbi:hypothetical protein IWQ57_005353, partial [Coemansia nantahalensis]